MMFCIHCAQKLPDDAVFCNRCGTRMEATDTKTREEFALDVPTVSVPDRELGVPFTSQPSTIKLQPPYLQPPPESQPPQYTQSLYLQPLLGSQPPQYTQPPPALNRIQRLLIQIFQPALASNTLFGVILGSSAAGVAGVLTSWLFLLIISAITSSSPSTGGDIADSVLGIIPLHMSFKDSLQLFLIMHGATAHGLYSGTGGSSSSFSLAMPLHGLLVIPALCLTLGGYIAACTDLHNHARRSLLLGSAIAIPYVIILFILSSQVNGNTIVIADVSGSTSTLGIDALTLLIYGLLWGLLFGALGASLKLARGQWRYMLWKYLQAHPYVQLKGMIAGSLSAAGLGIALSLLAVYSFLVYTPLSIPLMGSLCFPGSWQIITLWGIAHGPLHAVNLFFFLLGAPVTIHRDASSCFSTSDLPLW